MTVSFDTKVYLKGGRQYAHIKCSTSNNTVEKIVRCPRPVVNPSTFGGNVNSELTANQSCAINSRTGGRGGSRPKISKNMHIYRVFLSFNKDEISDLISTLGVARASFYITRAVGTRLKSILNEEHLIKNIDYKNNNYEEVDLISHDNKCDCCGEYDSDNDDNNDNNPNEQFSNINATECAQQ